MGVRAAGESPLSPSSRCHRLRRQGRHGRFGGQARPHTTSGAVFSRLRPCGHHPSTSMRASSLLLNLLVALTCSSKTEIPSGHGPVLQTFPVPSSAALLLLWTGSLLCALIWAPPLECPSPRLSVDLCPVLVSTPACLPQAHFPPLLPTPAPRATLCQRAPWSSRIHSYPCVTDECRACVPRTQCPHL